MNLIPGIMPAVYQPLPSPAKQVRPSAAPIPIKQYLEVSNKTSCPVCVCPSYDDETDENEPEVIYFDKKYIGNISTDTILNTIEFLESFVNEMMLTTTTTKKPKRRTKNRVKI